MATKRGKLLIVVGELPHPPWNTVVCGFELKGECSLPSQVLHVQFLVYPTPWGPVLITRNILWHSSVALVVVMPLLHLQQAYGHHNTSNQMHSTRCIPAVALFLRKA